MKPTHICQYPGCTYPAEKSFALVKLCDLHHNAIWEETIKYYRDKGNNIKRLFYNQIADMRPRKEKTHAGTKQQIGV